MEAIILPVVLENYSPRKDKTVSLRFSTQEMSSAQIVQIHERLEKFGVMYFKCSERLSESELKELEQMDVDVYDEPKSQSKRIRSVLYLLWKQEGEVGTFAEYYRIKTDKYIEFLKDKLD